MSADKEENREFNPPVSPNQAKAKVKQRLIVSLHLSSVKEPSASMEIGGNVDYDRRRPPSSGRKSENVPRKRRQYKLCPRAGKVHSDVPSHDSCPHSELDSVSEAVRVSSDEAL
ncbi:hypothetical protein B0T13DRAFT_520426 [Neurospora crassa]|nr:hypothetical protein B0T13DRAFT_520426 [Neurospora crassa]